MKNTEITNLIIKSYRRELWNPFIRALKEFDLIENGDVVALAFSGGKDSILLSYMLQELKRHSKTDFEIVYIALDAKYDDKNYSELRKLEADLGIDLNIVQSELYEIVKEKNHKSPCFLCARMRRGFLYDKAIQLGANKLALGHHMDDVVETIMMNMLYQGKYMTMMPKIKATNFENISLIRPMYYVEEKNIIKWLKRAELTPCSKGCPLKEDPDSGIRNYVKKLIADLELDNKNVKKSIQKSAHNVSLDAIVKKAD